MGNGHNFIDHILKQPDFHPEFVSGYPIIEIAGEHRVLIENHQGVSVYGKERIQINVRYGSVCVSGWGLEIIRMTKERLVIYGRIDSIGLQRRR